MIWVGIIGHSHLHVLWRKLDNCEISGREILPPYPTAYAGAIGDEFILMDDIIRPRRPRLFEQYFEDQSLSEWNGDLNLQTLVKKRIF